MSVDTDKYPKYYDFDPELWEGEWRKFMTVLYQGGKL